jgi:hypothetical protein
MKYIYIYNYSDAFFLHVSVCNIIQNIYNKTSSIVLVSPLISSNDCATMDVPGLISDNVSVCNIIQNIYNKTSSIVLVSPLNSSNDCATMDAPGLMSDNV